MKKLVYLVLLMFGAMNAQTYFPPYGSPIQNTIVLGGMEFRQKLGLPDLTATTFSPQVRDVGYNPATGRLGVHNGVFWEYYVKQSDLSGYVTATNLENTITYLEAYTGKGGGNIASNIKYGDFALQSNTTGYNNAAFAPYALYNNTTGSGNVAFGFRALYNNTAGNVLTAFGQYAGEDLANGSRDVFIGNNAAKGVTTASGAIFINSGANPSGATTANNSTIIGAPESLPANASDMVWLGAGTVPAFEKSSAGNVNVTGTTFTFNGIPVGIGYEPVRNIKTDATTSSITGSTSETILKSVLIPANSLEEGYLEFDIKLAKTGTANTIVWKIYKNTSNSLSGATQIATYTQPASTLCAFFHREFTLRGTGIYGYNFVGGLLSDDTATSSLPVQGTSFDRTTTNYIIAAAQLTDGADTATAYSYSIKFSKSN